MANKEKWILSDSAVIYGNQVIAEMENESDRATAVLLGAEIDDILGRIIEKHLLPPKNSEYKYNPANDFNARIELLYRLGFLYSSYHSELHLIRKIRNEFAHRPLGITFESPEVAKHISKLFFPKTIDQILESVSGKHPELKRLKGKNSREQFIAAGAILLSMLNLLYERISRVEFAPMAIQQGSKK